MLDHFRGNIINYSFLSKVFQPASLSNSAKLTILLTHHDLLHPLAVGLHFLCDLPNLMVQLSLFLQLVLIRNQTNVQQLKLKAVLAAGEDKS